MPNELIGLAPVILASAKVAYDVVKAWSEHASGKKRQSGIRQLYLALSATTDYIDRTSDLRKHRDRAIEKRLDEMWRKTAEAVQPIDFDLAQRLYLKADYWRNPDRFLKSKAAQSELDEAKITLKDIRGELLKLL